MYRLISVLALIAACSAVPLDANDASGRISNGEYTANLQYPYAVSIQYTVNTQAVATRGHRCGGALLTLQHVLTAASCMFEWNADGTRPSINPANYRVFAGANFLSNDTSVDRVRTIAQTIVHPNYLGIPSYLNDIAIVVLTTPFPNNNHTIPISLPASNYNPADLTECVMVGWGATNYGSLVTASVQQKLARKYIYNQQMCTQVFNPEAYAPNIMPTMICAASHDIVSAGCYGDEGNALVCGNILTGVLALPGDCSISSHPQIYTRVNNYTEWIRPYIASASTFSSGIPVLLFITLAQMAYASLLS